MKMDPCLAYIVVLRRNDDSTQKLVKAAGVAMHALARQVIDVAMFLDRESAETFRDNDILREYAEVVEVVVADSAWYTELENDFADEAMRVVALRRELDALRGSRPDDSMRSRDALPDGQWSSPDEPPSEAPYGFGRSREVLVFARDGFRGGTYEVANAIWLKDGGGTPLPPVWRSAREGDAITGVLGWRELPPPPRKEA